MNLLQRKSPVDLDKLAEELSEATPAQLPEQYAPRQTREKPTPTPLQVIAHAITRLTWTEAEEMGLAITTKLGAEPDFAKRSITSAIQEWAAGWEEFG